MFHLLGIHVQQILYLVRVMYWYEEKTRIYLNKTNKIVIHRNICIAIFNV